SPGQASPSRWRKGQLLTGDPGLADLVPPRPCRAGRAGASRGQDTYPWPTRDGRRAGILPHMTAAPGSAYRLQLQPGCRVADAGAVAAYLADLGVTHAYRSPILQAAPGSRHGYDVVDHSRVSADLGGEAALRAMVGRFRRHGLGVIVDVVPNHMGIPVPQALERQLLSVLARGPRSTS